MDINFTKATKRDIYRQQLERELAELIDPKTGRVRMDVAEYVPCPLCGELKQYIELFVVKGYSHVRCNNCGLVFVNPQVNEKNLHELYGQSKANDLWIDVITSDAETTARHTLYNHYFDLLEQFTDHRKIVDVGCSIGDLLMAAGKRGWDAIGFDLNRKAIDFAKNKRMLNAKLGKLEDFGFDKNSLPVVTLTGVLEHLNKPIEILVRIRDLLIDNGLILVQVPNLHSLHNMVLHERSTSFDGRNHLIFFTIETLIKTLELAGFKVRHIGTYQAVTHILCRYIQYYPPYEGTADFKYLPEKIRSYFENPEKHGQLMKWLEEMGLGRSIMAIASK